MRILRVFGFPLIFMRRLPRLTQFDSDTLSAVVLVLLSLFGVFCSIHNLIYLMAFLFYFLVQVDVWDG